MAAASSYVTSASPLRRRTMAALRYSRTGSSTAAAMRTWACSRMPRSFSAALAA
jgi:hypothetical protein